MKAARIRTFAIVMLFMTAFLFLLAFDASGEGSQVTSYREIEQDSCQDFLGPISFSNGGGGGSDEMKHITTKIENVHISHLIADKVFPNTPVDFIVETSGPTPEKITLNLDMHQNSMNITFDMNGGAIQVSDGLTDIVFVDAQRTQANYNASSRHWEIRFALSFGWSFPKDLPKDLEVTVVDPYGGWDRKVIEEAYSFEPDIEVTGEPTYRVDDPSAVTEDHYLRGGVNILLQQMMVHFEGVPEVSPAPSDIIVGVKDSSGRFWEYKPTNREQLQTVSFSLPVPRMDGRNIFEFTVFESPPGSVIEGKAYFDFKIDSTPPTLADFRYSSKNGDVHLDWALVEDGSGLDFGSMEYSLFDGDSIIHPWSPIVPEMVVEGRLKIDVSDIGGDELSVRLKLADRVGNDHPSDQSYDIVLDPKPAHDISIGDLTHSPDNIIINQGVTFFATVYNHGTEDEGEVQVEVSRNGDVEKYIDVELPAGSSREIRWTWKAVEGTSDFRVVLDPQGRVEEDYPSDNTIKFLVEPDYLDITARTDHLMISDPDAENTDIVTLTFAIRSIGGIESGPIKVTFLQDGKFMGLYQVPSIYKEGSKELNVDWKVDTSARNLTLMIDPYNEILESVEDNNNVVFPNPFYEPETEAPVPVEEPEQPVEPNEDQPVIDESVKDVPTGGTIWRGEEIKEEKIDTEVQPGVAPLITPAPEDPEVLPPYILPTAGFVIGTGLFGLAVFGMRSEVFKFKLLGLLIPLYSKLKKNKIEKGVRHEILGYLKAKPGANYSELKRNLDLNDGSLVHHLRVLEREERIYSKKMGKYKLFYVSSYRRQASIRDYISPFQLRIMELILQNPGIVPKKLSRILDRSQTDMSYHLGELARNGLLEKRKKGRNIHYYISDDYSDLFSI
ncbi:MAG: CARDB domain-containing protein [Thermoplasmatota archaeon]